MRRFQSRFRLEADDPGEAEINMAPLIDMIFILLIFFLVTASFVRESGVEVERPVAASAAAREKPGLRIAVTQEGEIFMDRQGVDMRSLRGRVELFLMENPGGGVLIEADAGSRTGRLVSVLDQVRLAGAEHVAVAARSERP